MRRTARPRRPALHLLEALRRLSRRVAAGDQHLGQALLLVGERRLLLLRRHEARVHLLDLALEHRQLRRERQQLAWIAVTLSSFWRASVTSMATPSIWLAQRLDSARPADLFLPACGRPRR
jgi:hypothetical protein